MSTIAELNIDITGSTAGLQSSMDQASGIVERAGKKMTSAGKTMTAGVSAPLGAIGGLAVHAANALNENLGNVQSLGLTQERVEDLRDSIQEMSIAVGKDTSDLGDGLYQVVSAFGDSADTVEILEINAKAAAAGLASTTDAINLTSAVTKGYGDTSADAVKQVSDLAFKTVQLGQTTFPELASSMGRVVPLGSAMGASMEELFGVMATATGVTGSAAEVSTQLRGVLQSMAAPTGEMSTLIEKWGYSSGQAAIDAMGLQGVIEGIVAEADASGQPLQKYISSIEGQTLALALAGPQADVFTDKLNAMESASGSMEEAFSAQTEGINSTGFAMNQARQKMNVFLQNLGTGLLPALTAAIDLVMPLADHVLAWSEAFAGLDPNLQMIIAGFTAFLIALGPVLFIAGQLVTSISALAPVFSLLGAALGVVVSPIGLVVAGLGAMYAFNLFGFRDMINGVATAIFNFGKSIVDNWDPVKDFIDLFINMDMSQEGMKGVIEALPSNLQPVAETLLDLREAGQDLWDALKWVWEGEGAEVDWWWDITSAFAEAFGIPEEAADAFAEKLYDVGTRVSEVIEGIRGSWEIVKQIFTGEIDTAAYVDAAAAIETAFGAGAADTVLNVASSVRDIYDNVVALASSEELANLGTTFTTALGEVATALQNVFSGEFSLEDLKATVVEQLNGLVTAMSAVFEGEAFTGIKESFTGLFDAVGIGDSLTGIQTAVAGFAEALTPYLEGPLARLKESFSGLSSLDVTPITEGLQSIKDAFDAIFGDEDATGAGFDLLGALGIAILQTAIEATAATVENGIAIFQAMIETVGNILTLFGEVAQGVRDVIDGALNQDMAQVIEGVQEILTAFVDFVGEQVGTLTNLGAKIAETVFDFVGFTFEDIGILLNEPEWLVDLIDWIPDTPEWVTSLTTWEWEKPDWVASLLSFRFPRPGWLGTFESVVDKITGWAPDWLPGFQMGTAYAPGGLALVGERGPEIVNLPRGSRVFDNRTTRGMVDEMGGGTTVVIQNATIRDTSDVYRLAEEIDAMKRRRR